MSARQSAGIPVGGQFAANDHAEPAVAPPPGYFGDTQDSLTAMSPEQMSRAQVRTWSEGEISHHVSPAVGWLRLDLHKGNDTAAGLERLQEAYGTAGDSIAGKFGSGVPREPAAAAAAAAVDAEDRLERLQLKPGSDMGLEEIKDWVALEFQERLTPLRDRIIEDGTAGRNTRGLTEEFMAAARGFAADIAAKFRPAPTAEDIA